MHIKYQQPYARREHTMFGATRYEDEQNKKIYIAEKCYSSTHSQLVPATAMKIGSGGETCCNATNMHLNVLPY